MSGLDGLFILRGVREPRGVCVVAIDDDSYDELGVREGETWPRAFHADLVRTLKSEGASAVAFDVLFDDERDAEGDGELAAAIAEVGNVALASSVETTVDRRYRVAHAREPIPSLKKAAAAVGEAGFPPEGSRGFRRTWLVREGRPSLALAAYEVATRDRSHEDPTARMIDYYGPGRTVETVSYYQAMSPGATLRAGFFKNRIVFVGLSQPTASGPAAKDSFPTPFSSAGNPSTYGVEIHATVAANLLEGRRIRLLPPVIEGAALVLLALGAASLFLALRPVIGAFVLLLLVVGVVGAGSLAFTLGPVWVPVVIPAVLQLPAIYVASVVWYYVTTVRERERIRRAFSFYLSPEMIQKVTADPASLNLGGEEIIATALFTDVKGFTAIAESMAAHETAALLNAYFSEITQHIFREGGTLIKFIGDAVFAIWGAPLRMADHATPACAAALAVARSQKEAAGRGGPPGGSGGEEKATLITRIGVHTGPMLVGNLGSEQRFDYTAIGDAVNVASRLEGLNKHLGTRVLVSGPTLSGTGDRFLARPLGRVRVVGKKEPIPIFELLGERGDATEPGSEAIARFERALADFLARRFEEAARGFEEVLGLCAGGRDGPSELFLEESRKHAASPPGEDWDGAVVFESK